MENIYALIEKCGLGIIKGQIIPVSGGYMHRMFKVHTTKGTYAVKCLNPGIMSRPDAMKNYSEAENLECVLERNDIPVVVALTFDGKKLISQNGSYYYIFPWQEGKITDFNAIKSSQCFTAGKILGRIHAIDPIITNPKEPESSDVDFEGLLGHARKKESVIAPLLKDNITFLYNAQNELNEARKRLPDITVISDDDMDPKNILWHEENAYVIDLECLGYSNPVSSCLSLALQWAGTVNCRFSKENLKAFFEGYLSAYDNGFRAYEDMFGIAYTWIEWLEYNIKRALGMEATDHEEIKLGEAETLNTINRMKYLSAKKEEICLVLKELFDK